MKKGADLYLDIKLDLETEIKHKAFCVFGILGKDGSKEDIERVASYYGITYNDCMRWKDRWVLLEKLNEDK